MNYNWNEYRKLAEIFEVLPDSYNVSKETKVRNSISRMFYHAFHCLKNWAEKDLKYCFQDGNHTHDHLIRFLRATHHEDKASNYKKLRDIRVVADYDDNINDFDYLFELSKQYYNSIVEPLAKYSQKE